MGNYYVQIQEFAEKLILNLLNVTKEGIKYNGDRLSLLEIYILKALANGESKRMYDLIDELKIDRNSFNTLVHRLQNNKYIEKRKLKEDKRVQILQLTDKGMEAIKMIIDKEKEALQAILRDFSFNEEKTILKLLVKLDMYYKKSYNE